jgi:predicted nucleotidyltransferase
MNEASQWRLEVAHYAAPIIARNPKVKAIVLGGSVSRGNADSYSDIEINVIWAEPPTEADRLAPIEPAGGVFWELDPYDPAELT